MQRLFLGIFICFLKTSLFSQRSYAPNTFPHQLELRHDNDFLLSIDRYYSSGLFLTYRTILKKGVFGEGEQLRFRLGQEAYTPAQTQSVESTFFDRPYAGFTGLLSSWSSAHKNSLIDIEALIGLAGNSSGARGFQRWYHRAVAIFKTPLWIDELNNSFHINLYATYTKEWELAPNPFGVRIALQPKLAMGSRDIFGETETVFHFGRRTVIGESIAYNRLGNNAREILFALRLGYREVLYNGLIEGNFFGDDSPVLRESENSLLRFGLDFNYRFNRNDYKIGMRYNSSEAIGSESHIYIQLSYAISW